LAAGAALTRHMSLTAGTSFGDYSIVRAIGAGGMGEVYLAEDTRLRRRVALKVLPAHLEMDDTSRKRLLREARAAARLDHPNICTVYEVGEEDACAFIAMQYVEGQTLAERLKRAPLELPTAIRIATQVANAVAEAHQHGIVHRDIKPQNIIISSTNHATVLDFGLAKTAGPHSHAATATVLTESGVVSGTVAYMSPEQARGETVDERSDAFSFGIVLYEMITRTPPFAHGSWADTLAAILTREPRPIDVPIPSELRRILRKCLEKDRSRRYQTMPDLAIDLENLAQELSTPPSVNSVAAASAANPGIKRRRTLRRAAIAALTLAGVAAVLTMWVRAKPAPVQSDYEPLTDFTDSATAPVLSPDGRMVTFIRGGSWFMTDTGQVYVKTLPNGESVRLTDDPRPKFGAVFSPDGSRVAYTQISVDGARESWDTWTVPASGGTPTRLLANAAGLSWLDSRHVLFSEIQPGTAVHMGLVTSTEDRRDARRIYLPAHERAMAHFSYPSPDRAWLLVAEMGKLGTWERCRLLPFDGSSAGQQVGPAGRCTAAAWSPDGHWMYFAAEVDGLSHLWRQRFPDGTTQAITSGPTTEEQGVVVAPDGQSLVTSIGSRQSSLWLHSPPGERLLSSEGYAFDPRLSADGTRMYYLLRRAATSGVVELRMMDLASQKTERLLPDFSVVGYSVSRDDKEVAVTITAADRSLEIWVARLDRRTAPRRIVQGGDNVFFGAQNDLIFRAIEGHQNFMTRIGLDGHNRVRISDANAVDVAGSSPDGRWVMFTTSQVDDISSTMAVPVYGGDAEVLCHALCVPKWSPDTTWLYLRVWSEAPGKTLMVRLQPGQPFLPFRADGGDAFTAWQKLPGATTETRDASIPGNDPSTYITAKYDERRNLYRIPLP
jgi:eukaryotic-like serine/threonine-protein kinase